MGTENVAASESSDSIPKIIPAVDFENDVASGPGNDTEGIAIAKAEDRLWRLDKARNDNVFENLSDLEAELPMLIDLMLSRVEEDQQILAAEAYAPIEKTVKFHQEWLLREPDAAKSALLESTIAQTRPVQHLLGPLNTNIDNLAHVYELCTSDDDWIKMPTQDLYGNSSLKHHLWKRTQRASSTRQPVVSVRSQAVFCADAIALLCMFYDGRLFQGWVPGVAEVIGITAPLQQAFSGTIKSGASEPSFLGEFNVIGADALDRNSTLLVYGETKEMENPACLVGIGAQGLADRTLQTLVHGGVQARVLNAEEVEITLVYVMTCADAGQAKLWSQVGLTNIERFALGRLVPYAMELIGQELFNMADITNLSAEERNLFAELQRRTGEIESLSPIVTAMDSEGGQWSQCSLRALWFAGNGKRPVPCPFHGGGMPQAMCPPCHRLESTIPCLGVCRSIDQCSHVGRYLAALAAGNVRGYKAECAMVAVLMGRAPAIAPKADTWQRLEEMIGQMMTLLTPRGGTALILMLVVVLIKRFVW